MKHSLVYLTKPKYSVYKRGALTRNLEFLLSREEFDKLINSSCFYCGEPGINGIDRVDNTLGYVPGNCVSACKHCNYVKGDLSVKDFTTWKDRFIKYQIKKKPS